MQCLVVDVRIVCVQLLKEFQVEYDLESWNLKLNCPCDQIVLPCGVGEADNFVTANLYSFS